MSKLFKTFLLIVTLAVPLAIFIFLRLFGDNRFDIEIYYPNGVLNGFQNCNYGEGQFLVPDSLTTSNSHAVFLFYKKADNYSVNSLGNQLQRIRELFPDNAPGITIFTSDSITLKNIPSTYIPQQEIEVLMNCALVTEKYNQFILVDAERRIRGYFDTDLDEVDRLIVEIKILLENGARK